MWNAWANAVELENVLQSPELAVVCSAIGKMVEWTVVVELGSSTTC